jgi:hypothetical protein
MASVVVDDIISRYILDASKFEAGAKSVIKSARDITTNIGDKFSSIGGAIGKASMFAGLAAVPFIGLAKSAIEAYVEMDTLSRTLTAVTGSAERTAQIMDFIKNLAVPSVFSQMQLGEGAKLLEAFRLNTERFLPVAEKLATVFGDKSSESLEMFIRGLGKLKTGEFGEAFQLFKSGGLSPEDLISKGLKFSKSNEYLGDAKTALAAIEQLVNEKYGKLSKEMASSPAAAFASLGDQAEQALIQIGRVLTINLLPVMVKFSSLIEKMVNDGGFTKITNMFMKLLDTQNLGDKFIDTVLTLYVTMQNLPAIMETVKYSFLTTFNQMRDSLIRFTSIMAGLFIGTAIYVGIARIVTAFLELKKAVQAVTAAGVVAKAIATDGASIAGAIAAGIGAIVAWQGIQYGLDKMLPESKIDPNKAPPPIDIAGQVQKFKQDLEGTPTNNFMEAMLKAATNAVETDQIKKMGKDSSNGILKDIKQNTKNTAENTQKLNDIQDRVLGGGTLGGRGLSRQELFDIQNSRGGTGSREIKTILVELGVAIEKNMSRQTARAIGNNVSRREI